MNQTDSVSALTHFPALGILETVVKPSPPDTAKRLPSLPAHASQARRSSVEPYSHHPISGVGHATQRRDAMGTATGSRSYRYAPGNAYPRCLPLLLAVVFCLAMVSMLASPALASDTPEPDGKALQIDISLPLPHDGAPPNGQPTAQHSGANQPNTLIQSEDNVRSAETSSKTAFNNIEQRRFLRVLIPIALLLSVIIGFLLWEIRRRARDNLSPLMAGHPIPPRQNVDSTVGLPPLAKASSRSQHISTGELQSVTAHDGDASGKIILHPSAYECPQCGREFEGSISHCPFDGANLSARGSAPRPPRLPIDRMDTSTAQMVCPQCSAAYELGAAFCPDDGEALQRRLRRTPEVGEDPMLCPTCGKLCEATASYCPDDRSRLISTRQADDATPAALSLAPLRICTTCATEFPMNTEVCPSCDEPLHFMHGRRTAGRALPTAEKNPSICPECGTRYAASLSYCVVDGTRLVALN